MNTAVEPTTSFVTDWGYDLCERTYRASSLFTHMLHIDDLHHGIRAEDIEILVTVKPAT